MFFVIQFKSSTLCYIALYTCILKSVILTFCNFDYNYCSFQEKYNEYTFLPFPPYQYALFHIILSTFPIFLTLPNIIENLGKDLCSVYESLT